MRAAFSFTLFTLGALVEAKSGGTGQDVKWYAELGPKNGMCAGAQIGSRWVVADKGCIFKSQSNENFKIRVILGLNCETTGDCKINKRARVYAYGSKGNKKVATAEFAFMLLPWDMFDADIRLRSFDEIPAGQPVKTFLVRSDKKVKLLEINSDSEEKKVTAHVEEKVKLLEAETMECRGSSATQTSRICLDVGCKGHYSAPVIYNDKLVGITSTSCDSADGGPQIRKITKDVINKFYTVIRLEGTGAHFKWYAKFRTYTGTGQKLQLDTKFRNKNQMCAGAQIGSGWLIADKECIFESQSNNDFKIGVVLGLICITVGDCKITKRARVNAHGSKRKKMSTAEFAFMALPWDIIDAVGGHVELSAFDGIPAGERVKTFFVRSDKKVELLEIERDPNRDGDRLERKKTHLKKKVTLLEAGTMECRGSAMQTGRICLDIGCEGHYSAPVIYDNKLVGISSKSCKSADGGPQIRKITRDVINTFNNEIRVMYNGPLLKWYATFQTYKGTCGGTTIGKGWAIAEKECIMRSYDRNDIEGKIPLVLTLNCENRDSCTKQGERVDAEMPGGNEKRTTGAFAFMRFPDSTINLGTITLGRFDDTPRIGITVTTTLHGNKIQLVHVKTKKCKRGGDDSSACLSLPCHSHHSAPVVYKKKLVGISARSCTPGNSGPQIHPITNDVIEKFKAAGLEEKPKEEAKG